MSARLSVVVLTLNEEELIARALESVAWADECIVLDSGSTDRTAEIATAHGARVVDQPWLGWPAQRNAGAALCRNDWVMFLEADEIVTPELRESIEAALADSPDPSDGFYLDRRGDFLGVLLPNEARPSKQRAFIRIYNRSKSSWDTTMAVHEEVLLPGRRLGLRGPLLHWRGYQMADYVPVFDKYSTIEARGLHEAGARVTGLHVLLRPVLRFGWLYVIRGDWRLGAHGVVHSGVKAMHEFLRYAKAWEMANQPVRVVDPPAEAVPTRARGLLRGRRQRPAQRPVTG